MRLEGLETPIAKKKTDRQWKGQGLAESHILLKPSTSRVRCAINRFNPRVYTKDLGCTCQDRRPAACKGERALCFVDISYHGIMQPNEGVRSGIHG